MPRYSANNAPSDVDFYGEDEIGTCPKCKGDTTNFVDTSDEDGESKRADDCDECVETEEQEELL